MAATCSATFELTTDLAFMASADSAAIDAHSVEFQG